MTNFLVTISNFALFLALASGLEIESSNLVLESLGYNPSRKDGRGEPPNYANLTTPEIIETFGYSAEIHHVTTEDGYILELHRIPYGINGSASGVLRPVAFLQHCLLCSSSDWVMDKPDRSLAYLLADAGYDVWMNNVRGNTYSRNHSTLDPDVDKKQFWEFTWDEMALHDVPAAIDYVLEQTGNTQVYYIGFSMGTTVFFALMSEKPQYANKIKTTALLAPIVYVEHARGLLRVLANYSDDIELILELLGHYEILPSSETMDYLAENFCAEDDVTAPICYDILFLISGYDPEELNKENVPIILSHTPAGTSTYTVDHYAQLVFKGVFQMYDWGRLGNQDHYGQREPPLYNISGDTPPIALYWGQNDFLATPEDVGRLETELKNVVLSHKVEWSSWNHLDFAWGIHAKEYVYDYVLDYLSRY